MKPQTELTKANYLPSLELNRTKVIQFDSVLFDSVQYKKEPNYKI